MPQFSDVVIKGLTVDERSDLMNVLSESIRDSNDLTQTDSELTSDDKTMLFGIYEEICKSHQAIDDFRMKLLGFLPLASLTGIFFLSKSDNLFSASGSNSNRSVAFIAVFAGTFTLALLVYEIRGILRCHDLICRGCRIEEKLKVYGQFRVCVSEHAQKRHRFFNAKVAASVTYSVVFAAWTFLALHPGFGYNIRNCTVWALVSGLLLALGVHWLIIKRIAA